MTTIFIILIIISIVLLSINIKLSSSIKTRRDTMDEVIEKIRTFERNSIQREIEIAVAENTKAILGISGDLCHGISYIIEKGIPEHIGLIEKLGELIRGMYDNNDNPLHRSYQINETIDLNNNYTFPGLNELQNKELKLFLNEITKKEREPVSLLLLVEYLLYWDDFDKALQIAKNAKFK